ncbi:MAG TPA: hypothetical protein VLN91_00020, partial [Nitrospirota bacterium]|nr:hypothetical protein [Nitrospirota bacterium]
MRTRAAKIIALTLGAALLLIAPPAFVQGKTGVAKLTPKTVELQTDMRDLWIGHIFWVRDVVLSTRYGDTKAAKIAEGKVVENAKAIGGAIVPLYGKKAGDKLFGLLAGHYGAVKEYMTAAFAGDADGKGAAVEKLKKNAEEMATFLSSANPHWPKQTLLGLLMAHSGHHIAQIDQVNSKDYSAEARTWDNMRKHIYTIADALTD